MEFLLDIQRGARGQLGTYEFGFHQSGLAQTNLGLGSLCVKFKELEIEEMVGEKGQSERTQLRPEPRATYSGERKRTQKTEKQQTVPRRETWKTLQGD